LNSFVERHAIVIWNRDKTVFEYVEHISSRSYGLFDDTDVSLSLPAHCWFTVVENINRFSIVNSQMVDKDRHRHSLALDIKVVQSLMNQH
jgi:hypothetical protein